MLTKLSVDQALMKARSHANKDEVSQAQKLYQAVLLAFPKNIRAQQGLAALNKLQQTNLTQSLPQETINQLVNLYNQGQFSSVVEQAQAITEQYPEAFIVWNILGASAAQIGMLDEAIEGYNKPISLKPDYAEAYSCMGWKRMTYIKYRSQGFKGLFPGKIELVEASVLAGMLIKYEEDCTLCSKIEEAMRLVSKVDIPIYNFA
jgi:tetratricopeptide (TPR) repeat protein|tara:strand:+ start:42 stop:653 length:612 start_codon:yes stop_codon:yes gene_type:complete